MEVSVHFVETGDVHASDAERHSEHGSTETDGGECHTCFCHAPTVFPVVSVTSANVLLPPNDTHSVFALAEAVDNGTIRELFRPPIS